MSDVVGLAEIDGRYAELLPVRTLMQAGLCYMPRVLVIDEPAGYGVPTDG